MRNWPLSGHGLALEYLVQNGKTGAFENIGAILFLFSSIIKTFKDNNDSLFFLILKNIQSNLGYIRNIYPVI